MYGGCSRVWDCPDRFRGEPRCAQTYAERATGGDARAATFAAGRTGMHVILMSGYAEDALVPDGLDASDAVYGIGILSAVRAMLGPPR